MLNLKCEKSTGLNSPGVVWTLSLVGHDVARFETGLYKANIYIHKIYIVYIFFIHSYAHSFSLFNLFFSLNLYTIIHVFF